MSQTTIQLQDQNIFNANTTDTTSNLQKKKHDFTIIVQRNQRFHLFFVQQKIFKRCHWENSFFAMLFQSNVLK